MFGYCAVSRERETGDSFLFLFFHNLSIAAWKESLSLQRVSLCQKREKNRPYFYRKFFCLMKSRIIFNGMNRYSSPASAQPGDCTSIVNLRRKSGELVPVGTPEFLYKLYNTEHKLIYIHHCYDGEHHISAYKSELYWEASIEKESGKKQNKSLLLFDLKEEEILSAQSIGNTLIVISSERTYYLLYKDGEYVFLGEKPEMPEISFFPYVRYTDAYWVNEYTFLESYVNPSRLETADINYFNDAYYNAFFQLQEKAWNRHYFIQPILIRYAITLYDGSQIFSSAPAMISLSKPIQPCQMKIRLKNSNNVCTGSYEGQIIAENYSIKYYIHKLNLDNWKDIVRSIDFFVAPEVTIFEPDQKQQGLQFSIERTETSGTITFYLNGDISFLDKKEIKDRYLQAPLFYKIASFEDWSDWKEGSSYELDNEIRPDQLVHEEVLSPDNTTLLSTGAQVSYVHNKRLHLANLKKKMFPGFPLSQFLVGNGNDTQTVDAYICTYLKTERGESRVVWSGQLKYFSDQLSPFLSYPDSNAYKMDIVIKKGTETYKRSFNLTPSEYENRADYLDESFTPIALSNGSIVSSFSVPSSSNDTYEQSNILRVSEYENPFIFPAEQTYSVSNCDITGIATITAALSEGQFGEFPLYLFTEEGIWALQNGTGGACYSAQHQLSRESILKEYPIVPLEDSIIFATRKGLSILRGAEIQPVLSFDEFPYENNDLVQYHYFANLKQACEDPTPLSEYFKNCSIAYNATEKELICCNTELEYSLIIHLPTLYMYRLSLVYTTLFYDTSHLIGQAPDGYVYNLQQESHNIAIPIALISRPITLQSEGYQRWRKVIWRLSAKEGGVTVSLWGGNNARDNMMQIYRQTILHRIPEQLSHRFTGPAYKYYRLALSGSVFPDFHLSGADVLFDIITSEDRLY